MCAATLCFCHLKALFKKQFFMLACLLVGFRKLFIFGNQISNELEI
jgi:hypothetical protein